METVLRLVMPAQNQQVSEPFRSILNAFAGGRECTCDRDPLGACPKDGMEPNPAVWDMMLRDCLADAGYVEGPTPYVDPNDEYPGYNVESDNRIERQEEGGR